MIVKTITEVLGWKQNPNLGFLKLPEVILFMFLILQKYIKVVYEVVFLCIVLFCLFFVIFNFVNFI